jgi:hypothetical protein
MKHQNIGLKALQYFQSYSEDAKSAFIQKAMDFFDLIGQTLVNGDIPQKYKTAKNLEQKCKHPS